MLSAGRVVASVSRRMASAIADPTDLFSTEVSFRTSAGDTIRLNAVYQDSQPSGLSLGTVIALHGAPGSHLDFKYVRAVLEQRHIRFIGVNYPGFGVTPDSPLLKFNNVERHDFVSKLMENIGLDGERVVFMGHSRGTENAIMLAAEKKAHGVVLLAPTGLRLHRGLKPFGFLKACNRAYNVPIPGIRNVLEPLFFQLYKKIKLKVPDGKMAAHCMQTMEQVALGDQKPFIDQINQSDTKVLFVFAGRDWLIENEISMDCAHAFDTEHFNVKTDSKEDAVKLLPQVEKSMLNKGCSVFFEEDGHFLQKHRADFIGKAVYAMLKKQKSKLQICNKDNKYC